MVVDDIVEFVCVSLIFGYFDVKVVCIEVGVLVCSISGVGFIIFVFFDDEIWVKVLFEIFEDVYMGVGVLGWGMVDCVGLGVWVIILLLY